MTKTKLKETSTYIVLGFALAAQTIAAQSAWAQTEDETVELYENNLDNREAYVLNTSIPTTPGITLAGGSAFDNIDHNIGSDLSYDISINDSGVPIFGISLRPYYSLLPLLGSAQRPKLPDESYKSPGWLSRTQVSLGFASSKKGDNEQLGTGLGILFYPTGTTDPRQDKKLRTCIANASDPALKQLIDSHIKAAKNISDKDISTLLSNIELETGHLNTNDPNVLALYRDGIEDDDKTVKSETKLKQVNFKNINLKLYSEDQSIKDRDKFLIFVKAQLTRRVVPSTGKLLDRDTINAAMARFGERLNNRLSIEPQLNNSRINRIMEIQKVVDPKFKMRQTSNDSYFFEVKAALRTYLNGLTSTQNSANVHIDTILDDLTANTSLPNFDKSLNSGYVNAMLRSWLILTPEFVIPKKVNQSVDQQVQSYLENNGANSNTRISVQNALEAARMRNMLLRITDQDVSDFLALYGLPAYKSSQRTSDAIYNQVMIYLENEHPELTDDGQDKIRNSFKETLNKVLGEATFTYVTASNASILSEIDKCTIKAGKRYLAANEFVFGVGLAGRSPTTKLDEMEYGGTSFWGSYRIPIGNKAKKGKDRDPIGQLTLFGRYIADDSVLVAKDTMADAGTFIAGATAKVEEDNYLFKFGLSYNNRNFADALLPSEEFIKASVGFSRRLSDKIWLETEFGEIINDTPFNEGSFGRVGFRFDGGFNF